MQVQMRWFRRERTFRAARKLSDALARFRQVSALDNHGGAQLVILGVAEDVCRELGETRAAQALAERADRVARSNEAALAAAEELSRKRKAARERTGDTKQETRGNQRPRRGHLRAHRSAPDAQAQSKQATA